MWAKFFPCLFSPHPQPTKGNPTGTLHCLFQSQFLLPSSPDLSGYKESHFKDTSHCFLQSVSNQAHPNHPPPSWEGRLPQKWGLGFPRGAGPLTLHSMYCSMGKGRREKGGREKGFRASQ